MRKTSNKLTTGSWLDRSQYLIMLLPMLILYLVFTVYPVIQGIFYSFTDWDGINSNFNMIGLDNYKNFFTDFVVLTPLKNTFIYAFFVTILQNICALALALALN